MILQKRKSVNFHKPFPVQIGLYILLTDYYFDIMINKPIIIEKTYNAPLEIVWKAITNPEDVKQWHFNTSGFRAEVGFEFQFVAGPDENKQNI